MKKLNYKKMVEDIDIITEKDMDFIFDMECNLMPESREFLQEEAKLMAEILGRIYSISHCVHCTACQTKYLLK